jgi:hypothetical protein
VGDTRIKTEKVAGTNNSFGGYYDETAILNESKKNDKSYKGEMSNFPRSVRAFIKNNVNNMPRMFKKKKREPIFHTEIAGEIVVVNILPADEFINVNKCVNQTPEHYDNTFLFYKHITESRTNLFKCLYILGDELLVGRVEGNKQDWEQFLYKSEIEAHKWHEKCKRSNKYFQATGRILGQDSRRFSRYLKTAFRFILQAISKVCPFCYFGEFWSNVRSLCLHRCMFKNYTLID